MRQSMSVSSGQLAGHKHNVEEEYRKGLANVVEERTHLNQVIIDIPLAELYEREFSAAVEEYNEGKRADRQIGNYLEKIQSSKQEKPAYEMVVQIGNRDTNSAADEVNRLASGQIYREFLVRFEQEFPQLKVHQAVIHNDEATPHLHVAYVPVSTGNKRGLSVKNSMRGALKQMGVKDVRELNERLFKTLEQVAEKYGVQRLEMGCTRAHLSVRDFKQMQAEIESEKYPYKNDPKLLELLDEQVKQYEQLVQETHEQLVIPLENLANKQPRLRDIYSNHRELQEISRAANALHERSSGTASRAKAFLAAVPSLWRDYIINPITDKLKELRGRYRPSDDLTEGSNEVDIKQKTSEPEFSGSIFDYGDSLIATSREANSMQQPGRGSRGLER